MSLQAYTIAFERALSDITGRTLTTGERDRLVDEAGGAHILRDAAPHEQAALLVNVRHPGAQGAALAEFIATKPPAKRR